MLSKDELLRAYREYGTFDEAAVSLGINRKTFSNWWYQNGLPEPQTLKQEEYTPKVYKIACAGDMHLGSKQQQKTNFIDFCVKSAESGARTLVLAGDLSEGLMNRPSAIHDRFLHSIDEIYNYVADTFDEIVDIFDIIHIVSGNHDESIGHRDTGFNLCMHLSDEFSNVKYAEDVQGMMEPITLDGGIRAIIYHGFGNCSRNLTTRTRNKTIDYMNARSDWSMLLCGHCHRFSSDYWLQRYGFSLGCFQSTTHFFATKGLTPDIRGDVITYTVDKKGVMRNVIDIPYIYEKVIEHDY